MRPGWLIGVPFSLVLHVALAAAVIALFRGGEGPPSLIVDLTAIVAGRDDGSSSSAGAPAPPPASRAGAKTGSARSVRAAARDDTRGASPSVAAPTGPTAPASVTTSRETSPPSPTTAVGPASAADVAAPIASQSLGPSAAVGAGRPDGVGVDGGTVGSRGAVGSGGAGGDRIAALGIAAGGAREATTPPISRGFGSASRKRFAIPRRRAGAASRAPCISRSRSSRTARSVPCP